MSQTELCAEVDLRSPQTLLSPAFILRLEESQLCFPEQTLDMVASARSCMLAMMFALT